ncbi:hypothetical protein EDEG_01881 [Edhazardia aedis USNM 41457]|uniref:Histone deacetylase n=1 Tax=Edhazardia aedis (strain USNM 41457) TaxID=1003232 RepID=J8ZVX4_EDHAE|nr:hypothetical protein EDEG_01881 [Edhazardia aedis USNM 41457]|eukprot:EJW03823.1 hypothetical protein EDEG_01881 [Edhazardia aedis USNM 41457]
MKRIAYIFDPEVGNFHYGIGHPMKPHRISITNALIHAYRLDKHMDIIVPIVPVSSDSQSVCDDNVKYQNIGNSMNWLESNKNSSNDNGNNDIDSNNSIDNIAGDEIEKIKKDEQDDFLRISKKMKSLRNSDTNQSRDINSNIGSLHNEKEYSDTYSNNDIIGNTSFTCIYDSSKSSQQSNTITKDNCNDNNNSNNNNNDSNTNISAINNNTVNINTSNITSADNINLAKDFLYIYHTPEYISSLQTESKTDDCPCFTGLEEYYVRYSYSTLTACYLLSHCNYDIAINYSGGLHHAKKTEASGFCYVNDIVLGIKYMLHTFSKIMYIDIDIHHGDGVEESFYDNNNVLTISFHKYGDNYFPQTGELFCNGTKDGKYYSVNVPLKTGIDDSAFLYMFKPVVRKAYEKFKPDVIVLQCGGDSLANDKIGCFNLSLYGHGECVKFVKKLGAKLLILGGGGYTPRNVSRLWCYETSILCGVSLSNNIPKDCVYYEHFAGDYSLHPNLFKKFENFNTRKYLDTVKGYVLDMLDNVK